MIMNDFPFSNKQLLQNPIIIISPGRVGSTIISDILFKHEDLAWQSNYQELFPKFAGINYLRRLFDNKYWHITGIDMKNKSSFRNYMSFRPIERYDFWKAVTGNRIDFSRSFLLNEKATPPEIKHIRSFFEKMVKFQKRKRLALRLTGPSRLEYLTSIFPDAQFINVETDDSTGNIYAWIDAHWNDEIQNPLWWNGAYSAEELEKVKKYSANKYLFAAYQYRKLLQTIKAEIERIQADVYTVNYNEFQANPTSVIKNIMQHVNLPSSTVVDKFLNQLLSDKSKLTASKTPLPETVRYKVEEILNS